MIKVASPYNLLQEIYNEHPWRMLVCCIMLNCTSRKQVDQVRDEFFIKYPEPSDASCADSEKMAELISILGFKNKRTNTIKRFSNDWVNLEWSEPNELYGIGKYGQDSWEIFQKGNLAVTPTDGVLNTYLDWAKTQTIKPV
jgi:methyl-CpG-binding domain protein 4